MSRYPKKKQQQPTNSKFSLFHSRLFMSSANALLIWSPFSLEQNNEGISTYLHSPTEMIQQRENESVESSFKCMRLPVCLIENTINGDLTEVLIQNEAVKLEIGDDVRGSIAVLTQSATFLRQKWKS